MSLLGAKATALFLSAGAGFTGGITAGRFALLTGSMTGQSIRLAEAIANGRGEDMAAATLVLACFGIGSAVANTVQRMAEDAPLDAVVARRYLTRAIGVITCFSIVVAELLISLVVETSFARRALAALVAIPMGYANFYTNAIAGHSVTAHTQSVQILAASFVDDETRRVPGWWLPVGSLGIFLLSATIGAGVLRAGADEFTLLPAAALLALGLSVGPPSADASEAGTAAEDGPLGTSTGILLIRQ
jgi:uncharacterized membrane protein YoaK (UPF0700 family)